MSRALQEAVEQARAAIAETVTLSVGAIKTAMKALSEDDIKKGFSMSPKEAPLWAHAATGIAKSLIAAEQKAAGGMKGTALAVVVIEKAGNNEQWLQMAAPYTGRKSAIEAVAKTLAPAAAASSSAGKP